MPFNRLAPLSASLIILAALSSCAPRSPAAEAERAATLACRRQADQVYLKQNRFLLSQRDTTATPFSSSGSSGVTSAGLGQAYGRDEMVQSCMANFHDRQAATSQTRTAPSVQTR